MQVFNRRIQKALDERREKGLFRQISVLEGGNQSRLRKDESEYVNFSNNDYLGLASEPELVKAWQKGLSDYGVGSGASPLVTGFSPAHQMLEETLCEWLGYEKAVLFNSGFSANQAALFSLLEKQDTLIQDKLNHASLMEAGMLSPATMRRFRHNDTEHLNQLLTASSQALVVTEGVFSMDGDRATLQAISAQCTASESWLMVDDAHGIGVLGGKGAGSCSEAGIKPELLVVTFGKAFGLSGAAIMCSKDLGDYLVQFARHHVYSTAMPPAQAYTLACAAKLIQSQQWRRDKLAELQMVYKETLSGSEGYLDTDTPIKPYICGDADKAVAMAESLRSQGFWVSAIRPPTVPSGSARLRITLTANHSASEVNSLCQAILKLRSR
ncbi:8-amino-7-oxononanoate synthase [Vibrio sp. JC009]|uniref:8-amino-7-oxononanoate synthase n=1 Tax=Vibrio sp. JC009 TaxID=2912314 RepID=UPI0023B0C075|nr:8-amino-7-oxononanoate synthase [Vibrio sp. JC009]WED22720.1 8-amino-7-oxononanoate synthase [Vibrio sp. JC009]